MITGVHDEYRWLATDHDIEALVRVCPQVVVGRYLAITAVDSSPFVPNDDQRANGWKLRDGIAYSSRIQSAEELPLYDFTEWYAFDKPIDPERWISLLRAGRDPSSDVGVFANYYGFGLHVTPMQQLIDRFWGRLHLLLPESYVGDASDCLTYVTRDAALFTTVARELGKVTPRVYRCGE